MGPYLREKLSQMHLVLELLILTVVISLRRQHLADLCLLFFESLRFDFDSMRTHHLIVLAFLFVILIKYHLFSLDFVAVSIYLQKLGLEFEFPA